MPTGLYSGMGKDKASEVRVFIPTASKLAKKATEITVIIIKSTKDVELEHHRISWAAWVFEDNHSEKRVMEPSPVQMLCQ